MKRRRTQAESSGGQLKNSGPIHSLGQARPLDQATGPLGLWRRHRETGSNTVGFSSRALLHLQGQSCLKSHGEAPSFPATAGYQIFSNAALLGFMVLGATIIPGTACTPGRISYDWLLSKRTTILNVSYMADHTCTCTLYALIHTCTQTCICIYSHKHRHTNIYLPR